jgi:hypothetical protein
MILLILRAVRPHKTEKAADASASEKFARKHK